MPVSIESTEVRVRCLQNDKHSSLSPEALSEVKKKRCSFSAAMVDMFRSLGALEQGGLVVVTDMSLAVVR